MVHSAYDSFELISDCPTKIEAIESYGPKLLLGCSDGSLKIYAPDSSSSDRSPPSDYHAHKRHQEPYALERNLSGFSKKPLVSMEVLESRELLLSLSESIAFHGLPNLGTIAVITKAKGANVYSWDDRRGFLCFARQKRVCIFRHDGGRGFVEVKEFGVPDVVKSMSWCGENICIGIRREYMILNSTNGALSEVFPSGRLAPPLVVSLPSGELLLGKDNIGVFVDQNGKLLQEGRVCWSEAPNVVVIQKPYAIALLPRYVEVRSLRAPYPLIQTVVLRNARRILQSNNSVIVALENAVYGLFPVPLGAQIVQLTASGDFEEALALCKLLPPEEASLRAAKEGSIHMRYAHHLFDNGAYEDAMEHFLASQVDITYVLSLYPSIVLPKTTMVLEPEKLMDISGDSSYLSRGSSGISDDMEPSTPFHLLESEESAALESKKMSHNTLMALIKFLQKKRYSIIEKATAEGTEEVVLDAVGNNFASYESNNRFKKLNKGRGSIPVTSGAREMAAILDTALLQALLLTGQASAALELLKGLNYCDVKICEDILQKNNHHAALLELYRCNSMHHEALKLLHQLVEDSKSNQVQTELIQKLKPESIVEYLKPLCGTDPMLVLEYSMLVLESCPTQTIELFLNGNIPADLVNSYLKQHAPNMQATYLELMLAMDENGISGNLQNEMVHIYLSEVLDWHADLSAQQQGPSRASSSSAAAQTRNSKKRTRASRRAPTTVLTTDTSNFRAMVQEFTGIPAPPFAASSSSSSSFSRRFDMFGSGMRSAHHLDTLGPLYPLRPSAQKVQQPTPFLSSNNSPSNSALLMMSNSGGLVDATNIATTSNNSNNNFNPTTYQLLNQGLFPSMQNPILTFQHEQQPHPFHSSSMNLASFGARPARGVIGNLAMHSSLEDPLGGMSHGSYTSQLGGGVGGSSLDSSHVAASGGHNGWRDHGVGSNDGRLSAALDQHLRPNLDKCLEMNNVNSNTRGEGTVESWICPNSE